MLLTGLSNSNQVMMGQNSRDGIRLDRSGNIVTAQTDVLTHDGVQSSIIELRYCQQA